MNASLIVSVTAMVLCVAITVAVYFAMSGDENAASYNYKVSFTSTYTTPGGDTMSSGSGTVVVNAGVQSFIYTSGSTVTVQEESGLTYYSGDGGASFGCVGDVGGLDWTTATPQNVAGTLTELEDVGNVCGGKSMYSIMAFNTPYFICVNDDGTPASASGKGFSTTVDSFEVDENVPFDGIVVSSDDVNTEMCEEASVEIEICAIDTAEMNGPTFEANPTCCSALGNYVRNQVDSAPMDDCSTFQACFGACHPFTKNFIDYMEEEAEISGAGDAFQSFCDGQDVMSLVSSCAASQRKLDTHWRSKKLVAGHQLEKVKANPVKFSAHDSEFLEGRRAKMEFNSERVRRLNRRSLVEEHGEDFHRHLSEDEIERRLSENRVCFMHGMGAQDNSGGDQSNHYWGDPDAYMPANTKTFFIQTNSKYCDYHDSGSKCTGAVPGAAKNSNGVVNFHGERGYQINFNGAGAGSRGSLPNQYKWFIDANDCNVIFAHSMGNPTMGNVYANSGNDEKYMWYDTNGPKRGSTAAQVVVEYCNQGFWDYFSFSGVSNALMYGVATAMGYCGEGADAHNALVSMVPHGTNKWRTGRGNCLPLVGGGPNCPDSRTDCAHSQTTGCGAHYRRGSEQEHWFQMETVNGHENKCTGWAWFGCAGRTLVAIVTFEWVCQQDAECEDSGDSKIPNFSNQGFLGAMCGKGVGYGLGTGIQGWGPATSGGDVQNLGLWLIHKVTDYGEPSDGMVSYSSCVIPGKEGSFGNSYTNNYYWSDQSHLDGTCFSGDGSNNGQKPCSWMGEMVRSGGGCTETHESNGNCASWKGVGYCGWHSWVQSVCPCTC
jgi:hypothetical protein